MMNIDTAMTTAGRAGKAGEADMWTAVLARDRHADGTFVYAVKSTGVFCRPSCPSRRPRREVVDFFATPNDARAAGFRPCRRCRPDAAAVDPWVEKIRRATVYLANVDGQPSLATLAKRVGGSPYHVQRNFKRLVGISPREFAEASRLAKVKAKLKSGADVTTAVFEAGYGSSSRFYENASARLGMAPSQYRHGQAPSAIRYTVARSPLGQLLVAATTRGICAVALGDSPADLERQLAAEFPETMRTADRRGLDAEVRAVLDYLDGQSPSVQLPLDIRATAFQWQVWKALMAIPRGDTRSYAEVAAAIGRPKAVRAVARACATNPVALVIPCHRVVPAAGGVGGYRWGTARKTRILESERDVQRRENSKMPR